MKQRVGQAVLILVCLRLALGCATIIHGSSQDVNFSSNPDNAEVWIDGAKMATTPGRVTLSRKHEYTVVIKKEGYKDLTTKIEKSTDAWIIGNVIFGGIIGCGVDFITGGAYDLKPERLDVNLTKIAELDGKPIRVDQAVLDNLKEIRFLDGAGKPQVVVQLADAK